MFWYCCFIVECASFEPPPNPECIWKELSVKKTITKVDRWCCVFLTHGQSTLADTLDQIDFLVHYLCSSHFNLKSSDVNGHFADKNHWKISAFGFLIFPYKSFHSIHCTFKGKSFRFCLFVEQIQYNNWRQFLFTWLQFTLIIIKQFF